MTTDLFLILICSLTVSGLWLVWQSLLVGYRINILKVLIGWFNNRPIILPSLFFLIAPFLLTYIFQETSGNLERIFDSVGSLDRVVTIFATSLATATSIFLNNRYLENFKQKKERVKISKIIIVSIQAHVKQLETILSDEPSNDPMTGGLEKKVIERISARVNRIRQDSLYESALVQIGIFEIKYVDLFSNYSRELSMLLDDVEESYNNLNSVEHVKRKIRGFAIDSLLCLMFLSQNVIKDENKFAEYKDLVKRNYSRMKIYDGTRSDFKKFDLFPGDDPLERTEALFRSFNLLNELQDTYQQTKSEIDQYQQSEQKRLNRSH